MSLQVTCPYCNRPMAATPAMVGQRVACPSCRGEILLSPAALLAPAGAAARSGPPVAPPAPPQPPAYALGPGLQSPALPPGSAPPKATAGLTGAAPPVVSPPAAQNATTAALPQTAPPAQAKTAQFLANRPAEPAIAPAADGKLPTLALADTVEAAPKAQGESAPTPLWLALLAVAGSTVVSLLLLTGDFTGAGRTEMSKAQARREIVAFYGDENTGLAPYQVHLREAQLAHSRGAYAAERDHYRKVLGLLRAEGRGRFEGLTGTPTTDAELARLLAILLTGS
jgi:hypothetical protein